MAVNPGGVHVDRANGQPKRVLVDLKIPRMDGLQVLKQMKHDALPQTIPLVMTTSSREGSDLLASYDFGVNSFVVKPVDVDAFAKTKAMSA